MSDLNAMFQDISNGVLQIVKQAAGQYASQAAKDARAFLDAAKPRLGQWIQDLSDGKITKDQFEFQAAGLQDVAALAALTEAGLAAATLDAVRSKIVSCVIAAVSARIP